jgi:hypothetical protein
MEDFSIENQPHLLACIWKELKGVKADVLTSAQEVKADVQEVKHMMTQKFTEHDDRLNKLEKHQEKQWERIDTLFDADVTRGREYLKMVAHRETEVETFKNLATRVLQLEQQLSTTKQQGELVQRTQHDEYDRAFSRSIDFENVFLFLLTFGYNTITGQTCVVFKTVQEKLCVCINFRALHLIAKLKLNYAQVTKSGKMPTFAMFRLNVLQKLFRDAKLPEKELDQKQVDSLYKRLAVKPMKTPAAKKASWIALEAEPFAFSANNLMLADKLINFAQLFDQYYPSKLAPKVLNDRDNCFYLEGKDLPEDARKPVFQVPYWGELFYSSMRAFRVLMNPHDPCTNNYHFLTLYEVDSGITIEDSFEEALATVQEPEPPVTRTKRRHADLEDDFQPEQQTGSFRKRQRPSD